MNSNKTSEKMAKQLAAIRHKKIEKLRNKIASGKYRVGNMDLAKALFLAN